MNEVGDMNEEGVVGCGDYEDNEDSDLLMIWRDYDYSVQESIHVGVSFFFKEKIVRGIFILIFEIRGKWYWFDFAEVESELT